MRRRRRLVVLLVVLVVLGGLFELADVLSRHVAEDTIATRAVTASGASSGKASIDGWPFLVDVARGKVTEVDVDLRNVPVGALQLSALDVALTGIGIDTNALFTNRALRLDGIDRASVAAVVTAAALTAATGDPVSFGPGRRIAVAVNGTKVDAQLIVVGGHVLELEHSGEVLLRVDLAKDRLVPDCSMHLAVSGQSVTAACTVTPVPKRVVSAISGAASSS